MKDPITRRVKVKKTGPKHKSVRIEKSDGSVRGKQKTTFQDGTKVKRKYKVDKGGATMKSRDIVTSSTGKRTKSKYKGRTGDKNGY